MGLSDGYGVLLGTKTDFHPEDPIDFGRYRHGMLTVAAAGQSYTCAIDVDTQLDSKPLRWRVQPLRAAEWASVFSLADGWHKLDSLPGSGAADYIRDPRLIDLLFVPDYVEVNPRFPPFPPEKLSEVLPNMAPVERRPQRIAGAARNLVGERRPLGRVISLGSTPMRTLSYNGHLVAYHAPWNIGTSDQALIDLAAVLDGAVRVVVMGEPFTSGFGVHNIHQNQGDPIDGDHAKEDGIWQDGITIALRADGTAAAFMNQFHDQSDRTNNQGQPTP